MRNEFDTRWKAKGVTVWEPSKVHTDAKLGKDCQVGAFCEIGPAIIGDNVRIGAQCFVPGGVTLCDGVFLGPGVRFTHNFPPEPRNQWKTITVGQGVKIGASVTILCGVKIGDHAVIGAGSIVTKDVPPGEVWLGNPAQRLNKKKSKGGK
jgi:UDP-2-acetamido-3-amino-2,3-dideoxy-glucuronate N-acetyltransferase